MANSTPTLQNQPTDQDINDKYEQIRDKYKYRSKQADSSNYNFNSKELSKT